MMRYSRALALVLALSLAVSSEGFRLKRKEKHTTSISLYTEPDAEEPSLVQEDVGGEDYDKQDVDESSLSDEEVEDNEETDQEQLEDEEHDEQDDDDSSFVDEEGDIGEEEEEEIEADESSLMQEEVEYSANAALADTGAMYEEEDGIEDEMIDVEGGSSTDAYGLVETDEFTENSNLAYPQPSGRTCPYKKLTKVCSEIGLGGTYDDMSSCPSKVVTPSKGWVCKERSGWPRSFMENPEKKDPGFITRQDILDRAVVWVEHGIRYSQRRYHKEASRGNTEMEYRTDCSGYVTMAWKLGVSPITGYFAAKTSSKLFRRVACNKLLPGDALVTASKGHILLFREWVSQTSGSYTSWEEGSTATGTMAYTRSFRKDMTKNYGPNDAHSMTGSSQKYLCLRRRNILGDGVDFPSPKIPVVKYLIAFPCPTGYSVVMSAAECRSAATYLGFANGIGGQVSRKDRPSGCYAGHNQELWLNTDPTSTSSGGRSNACKLQA